MTDQPVGLPLSMHDPVAVGPWTLTSRLGAGGMGVVYYGHAPGYGYAAVKVIRPGLLDAPATRDRFRREVAILRSVRDVHISQFLAADLESDPAWLAIEYVSGPVLRDEVLANGPLAEDQWWDLARGLAQALAVLEVHRITHRDLKPGNVILHELRPVVIDFGIAHPEDATALTGTGLVTGSPAWLSPEQANLEETGPPSDVFTLGSLLAFAATGRPPFGEGASVAVLVAITTKEPDLAGIDPVRTALLRRMLSKDPRVRPTARQVLDLTRAALSSTGEASPSPVVDPGTTFVVADAEPPSDSTRPDAKLEDLADAPAEVEATRNVTPPVLAPAVPAPPAQPVIPPVRGTASASPPGSDTPGEAARPSAAAPVGAPSPPASSPPAGPKRGGARRWIVAALLAVALAAGAWVVLAGGLFGGADGGTTPGASSRGPRARPRRRPPTPPRRPRPTSWSPATGCCSPTASTTAAGWPCAGPWSTARPSRRQPT